MSIKNKVFPLVAAALLVITGVVSGVTISAQNSSLESQASELSELTAQVEAAEAKTDSMEAAISLKDSGANVERVAGDTGVIEELLERALTWDSDASYNEARESTMRVYGLTEDSVFMTSFLPVAPVNRDAEGNEYPYIDAAGLNSQVGSVTVKLLSVDRVNYSYMVLVDVQAKSSDDLGTAVNVATVFVTIDGDGSLTNIAGFASTTAPKYSR